MKKCLKIILAIFLILIMSLCLISCGKDESSDKKNSEKTTQAAEESEVSPTNGESDGKDGTMTPTEASDSNDTSNDEKDKAPAPTTAPGSDNPSGDNKDKAPAPSQSPDSDKNPSDKNPSDKTPSGEDKPAAGTASILTEITIDRELSDSIIAILETVSAGNFDKYVELTNSDLMENSDFYYDPDDYWSDLAEDFEYMSEDFNDFTGKILTTYTEEISDGGFDYTGVAIIAKCKKTDVSFEVLYMKVNGKPCFVLNSGGSIDHDFYDFDAIIAKQLKAVKDGNKTAFLESVNLNLLKEIMSALITTSAGDSEISSDMDDELLKELQEMAEIQYDDLRDFLGNSHDGKVLWVESFPSFQDDELGDIKNELGEKYKLYYRSVFTVFDADKEYGELEAFAYRCGDKIGVLIQPD